LRRPAPITIEEFAAFHRRASGWITDGEVIVDILCRVEQQRTRRRYAKDPMPDGEFWARVRDEMTRYLDETQITAAGVQRAAKTQIAPDWAETSPRDVGGSDIDPTTVDAVDEPLGCSNRNLPRSEHAIPGRMMVQPALPTRGASA
jgi:hypothetical protein